MSTLVTGATGFACIHIVRALAEAGELVIAFDLTPADAECRRFLAGVEDRVQFVSGDVLDTDALLHLVEQHGVDRFVHGAAITPTLDVERASPQRIIDVNLMGTVGLLEIARQMNAWRFVFMSSSGVYAPSTGKVDSLSEESPLRAKGLYAICKQAGELILKRYKSLFGLSTVSGRMSSIYGPMERATASRSRPSTIYELVRACLVHKPVRARGRAFRRTFTRAEDAATIWRDLTLADDLDHDVYNVSAGVAYSLDEVLETLADIEPTFRYSYAEPGQEADIEITLTGERPALDMTRARTEFDFVPRYDLRQSLEIYLVWARNHPALFQER